MKFLYHICYNVSGLNSIACPCRLLAGVVVFTSDTHVTSIMSTATALQNEINDQISFIISEAVGLSDSYFKDISGDVYETSKGVYVVSPPQLEIDEFELYWTGTFQNVSTLFCKHLLY
jgi:hypothetical protein